MAQRAGLNLGYTCGDDPERVRENRQILRSLLPTEPHWLHQVHGREVLEFDSASPPLTVAQQRGPANVANVANVADAAITTRPSVVLCVLSADCLPIFMCNREGDAIGVCHAGWRGLAAGVVEASTMKLQQRRPTSAGWIAHLGPAIGAAAFEVGDDVRSAFCDLHTADAKYFVPTTVAGKYLADLYKLASRRLRAAGFQTISGGAYCTVRDEQHFYSYRRDRKTGRMASLIWIQQ
jgi:polyphenol oxidase